MARGLRLSGVSSDGLLRRQNSDGGWGYGRSSWTEPTALALLALRAAGTPGPPADRAWAWLARLQRPDGGWPPHPAVDQSTWVTALVLAGASERLRPDQRTRAVDWVLKQTGAEVGIVFRLRRWMLGGRSEYSEVHAGWPWFPGTAAWTTPTALTILALQKLGNTPSEAVRRRIDEGRRFLLSRMCEDRGWNHGSAKALGFQAVSYPETTGIALLALRGVERARIALSLAKAHAHLARCRSAEGASWLQLALLAHGENPARPSIPERTFADVALQIIAQAAFEGRDVFRS